MRRTPLGVTSVILMSGGKVEKVKKLLLDILVFLDAIDKYGKEGRLFLLLVLEFKSCLDQELHTGYRKVEAVNIAAATEL